MNEILITKLADVSTAHLREYLVRRAASVAGLDRASLERRFWLVVRASQPHGTIVSWTPVKGLRVELDV